jgi:tetratricopeptide (TPR) repeat protein
MRGELPPDIMAQANTLDSLGYIHSRLGHNAEAISCYQQAIGLLSDTRSIAPRAQMLANLGDAYQAAGDAVALSIHHRMPLAAAIRSCCPKATQRIAT